MSSSSSSLSGASAVFDGSRLASKWASSARSLSLDRIRRASFFFLISAAFFHCSVAVACAAHHRGVCCAFSFYRRLFLKACRMGNVSSRAHS